jgi:chemotaxis response regulator CheB
MPRRDIVAIGASAGGIDALQRLLGKLSPSFDADLALGGRLRVSA